MSWRGPASSRIAALPASMQLAAPRRWPPTTAPPPCPHPPPPARAQSEPYPADYSPASVARWPLLQRIRQKSVALVLNIHGNAPEHPQGNVLLRRAAADFAVPLLTNMNLVSMFADALEENARNPMVGLSPQTLFDYYAREKASDAWTGATEFH